MIEKIKNNSAIKYIIVFSITLLFGLYFYAAPTKARIIKEGTNTDAILNVQSKEEKQLWEKLKIIKSIGGNSINVPALAATLLYGSSAIDVADAEYDDDFNANEYRTFYTNINDEIKAKDSTSTTGFKQFESNSISKLIAASIVMIDSSGGLGGTYSDENYLKALQGDKLVGNLWGDDDSCLKDGFNIECLFSNGKRKLSYVYNAIFCGVGALADSAGTIFEIVSENILWNNSVEKTIDQKFNRGVTMANVCNYGYIEGIDKNIRNISDADKKAARKKEYAEGIINLAKLYRYYYEDDDCLYESLTDDEAANWRQCDAAWKYKSLGGVSNMCYIGCAVTSLAYIIKTSGTALTVDNFDPGVFSEKASFTNGNIYWQSSISAVAPKGHIAAQDVSISYSNAANTLKNLLETDTNGHKTFIQLHITNHYIALDHVEGDTIYVMDPAISQSGLVTLEDALNRDGISRSLLGYNVFYFEDVNSGSSTSSSKKSSTSTDSDSNSYKSDTYQKRLEDVSSLVDQKTGSVWNIDDTYESEDTIKVKMESGSAVSALAAAYYLYTGKTPDGYEFYKAAYDDKVKTDTSISMEPIINGEAKTLDEKFGLTGKKLSSYTIDKVIEELKSGAKVVAGVKDSSFGQDHYVLLDHYNEDTEQIYVFNPNKENQKEGYFSKDDIESEIINKVAYDLTVIYSDYVDNENNYCNTNDGDTEKFLELFGQIEGGCRECTVSSTGKEGCESYIDSADQTYVGKTTAWGITQKYEVDRASEAGYANFDEDMSAGCADKEYLTKIIYKKIEDDTETVKNIYEEAFPGKSLKTCQYHAFVLFLHHWPARTTTFIQTLGTMDFMSYEAYHWYLQNNGGGGMQGLLNRREAEYHLLNTCNYNLTKVMDATDSQSYWQERIKVYKEELGQS